MEIKKKISRFKGASFDSLLLAFVQIITYASTIATTKILSVYLSLDNYATYSAVMIVVSIGVSFTLFGLGDSLNYYYNNQSEMYDKKTRESFINTIYFIQLCLGIFVGLIILIFSSNISSYFNNEYIKPLLFVVCLKPWAQNAVHLFQVLFVSVGKAKIISIRNLIVSIIKICTVYVAVRIYNNLTLVFAVLVILDLVQLFIFWFMFGQRIFYVKIQKFDREKLKPVIQYAIPMGLYIVTNTLMRDVDKLVIGGLSNKESLAIYTNCSKTLPLNLIVTAFATVLVPYIMRYVSGKKYDKASSLFKNYLALGYLSIWMFCGALLICTDEAISFLYSDLYLSGRFVFDVYILDAAFQFASMHLIIAANGESKFLMKLSMILLALNTVLNVLFYYLFSLINMQILGPALSTLIMSGIYMVCVLNKSKRILQNKIADLLDIKCMIKYLCVIVGVGFIFFNIKCNLINLGLNKYIVLISICISYCFILLCIYHKKYFYIIKEINKFKLSETKT